MKTARAILVLGLGLLVSACASVEVPSRNAPFEQIPDTDAAATITANVADTQVTPINLVATAAGKPLVSVNSVVVVVPRTLKVSEANRYLPPGDIVWRGDPYGDRYEQVQAIFQDAMTKGVASLDGPVKVDIDIQVSRFHALSEKARYTTGGVHSITFDLAIKDPETGELLVPVRTIRADLDGYGGKRALQAEANGVTQKVRITEHLSKVIRDELTNPEGYKNASLGFFQILNNL